MPSHVPEATAESTPLESMEPDFGEEPKKMNVDALEATSSAEAELAQPLPRSRIGPLPGGKSVFALLDGPLPEKEVLVDSKPSKDLAPFVRKKSLLLPNPDGDSDSAAVQPLPRNVSRDRAPLRSCLARSASRPRSKTRGRDATRSRSRASPERRIRGRKSETFWICAWPCDWKVFASHARGSRVCHYPCRLSSLDCLEPPARLEAG